MRAGERQLNHYHPAATGNIIKEIGLNCYWFVLGDDGLIGTPLHRDYTTKHGESLGGFRRSTFIRI